MNCERCDCPEDDHYGPGYENRNDESCQRCGECVEFVPPGCPVEDRCDHCGAVCAGWLCPACRELRREEDRLMLEQEKET